MFRVICGVRFFFWFDALAFFGFIELFIFWFFALGDGAGRLLPAQAFAFCCCCCNYYCSACFI